MNAWRWVVNEFVDPLHSYARRFGHSDPDEVVGAVLETVARRITTFEGGHRELRTFVFSVAHARIVDEFRRRSGRAEMAHVVMDTLASENQSLSGPFALSGALSSLPASQHEVVRLRYVIGMTTEEIASVTGRSVEATRAVLSRALRQLRASLEPLTMRAVTAGEVVPMRERPL